MKTNSAPYSDQAPGATPDNTRVGNFYKDDGLANDYNDGYAVRGATSPYPNWPYNLTDVGSYSLSPSYFGTFDQGGNVVEWDEALISTNRGLRGGSYGASDLTLSAALRDATFPTLESDGVGFRVVYAFVPEPSTAILAASIFALLASRRHRSS
jgi:hypothetical protein